MVVNWSNRDGSVFTGNGGVTWKCQKTAGLRLIRTACELVGSGAKDPHGIPKYYKAHLDPGEKNHIPLFDHKRFNIVFKAASAMYHHRYQLRNLLISMQNNNRLHRAVLKDSANPIALTEIQTIVQLYAIMLLRNLLIRIHF